MYSILKQNRRRHLIPLNLIIVAFFLCADLSHAVLQNNKSFRLSHGGFTSLGLTTVSTQFSVNPSSLGFSDQPIVMTSENFSALAGKPFLADNDADGVDDNSDNCPLIQNESQQDLDGDGIGDLCGDLDGDGLNDYVETNSGLFLDTNDTGSNPNSSDTDGDGLLDGDEVLLHGTDPVAADTDGDGLLDGDEILIHGTDPIEVDTDLDSFSDKVEVDNGSNPLDANSVPVPTENIPFMNYWGLMSLFGFLMAIYQYRQYRSNRNS